MELAIGIVAILIILVGAIGAFLPVIPGPPLSFLGILLLYASESIRSELSTSIVLLFLALAILSFIADYFLPLWGTKYFGGTKAGERGALIGSIAGLLFFIPVLGPLAIIISPFIGAYAGEKLSGQKNKIAWRSAIGSFLGFIGSTALKLVISLAILIWVIRLLWF